MAASADRAHNTKYQRYSIPIGVKASTKIYRGTMVSRSSGGYAKPASDTASETVLGFCEVQADNSGSAVDGAIAMEVHKGVIKMLNYGSDAVVIGDLGKDVYVYDDQTVRHAGGSNNVVAGKCVGVESDGVWIEI